MDREETDALSSFKAPRSHTFRVHVRHTWSERDSGLGCSTSVGASQQVDTRSLLLVIQVRDQDVPPGLGPATPLAR